MKTSIEGFSLIKKWEGLRLTSYDDATGRELRLHEVPRGIATIGYGHTGGVYPGMVIDELTANTLLAQDVAMAETAVMRLIPAAAPGSNHPLRQGQFDALVDFTFNLGAGALGGSHLRFYINTGAMDIAADQFGLWVHDSSGDVLDGLVNRRADERAMFVS